MASRSMASKSMASWGIEEVPEEMEMGKETGLPLIPCPGCGRQRVIELRVKTNENGNEGRVFFKCPRNVRGMAGRCGFLEFQKAYLKVLVRLKYVVIDVEAGLRGEEEARGFVEEEAQSMLAGHHGKKNNLELKLEAMISILKMLIVVLFGVVIVVLMYVFKGMFK